MCDIDAVSHDSLSLETLAHFVNCSKGIFSPTTRKSLLTPPAAPGPARWRWAVGSAGSGLRLPRFCPFLSVELSFDFGMRQSNQSPHKTRKSPKVAVTIFAGVVRASWFLWHDTRSRQWRASEVNLIETYLSTSFGRDVTIGLARICLRC
jgi:hypothetical protein